MTHLYKQLCVLGAGHDPRHGVPVHDEAAAVLGPGLCCVRGEAGGQEGGGEPGEVEQPGAGLEVARGVADVHRGLLLVPGQHPHPHPAQPQPPQRVPHLTNQSTVLRLLTNYI